MARSSILQAPDPDQRMRIRGRDITAASGLPPAKEEAWLSRRKARPTEILLPRTVRWIATLPHEFQPTTTAELFPRIANALAALSTTPEELSIYLEELLESRREQRQGFPPRVTVELHALSAYQATVLGPEFASSRAGLGRHAF